MTWDELVTKYHKKHSSEIRIILKVEAYIQFLVLKKRRGIEEEDGHEEIATLASKMSEAMSTDVTSAIQV